MSSRMREERVDLAGELWDGSSCSAPERFRGSSASLGEKNAGQVKLQLLETEISGSQSLWENPREPVRLRKGKVNKDTLRGFGNSNLQQERTAGSRVVT